MIFFQSFANITILLSLKLNATTFYDVIKLNVRFLRVFFQMELN